MGRRTHHIDWITALVLLCLGSFGLFILLTIGQFYFVSQLLYLVLGFALLFAFSYIDPALLWWFAPIGYILSNISVKKDIEWEKRQAEAIADFKEGKFSVHQTGNDFLSEIDKAIARNEARNS